MKKTEEQKFLQVKEKLDYYRLPTIFPAEATDILTKVFALVGRPGSSGKENNPSKSFTSDNDLNNALRLEIGKTVKENNRLHSELMSARQEIQSLKENIDKHMIERSDGRQEIGVMVESARRREQQLFEELTEVKYKYNELMDMIHEDSQIEKQYIKRLLKHRRYEVPKFESEIQGPLRRKSQQESVTQLEAKISQLKDKLANRETEILRLQNKMEYDGLNMNKIMRDFENSRNNLQISGLQEQVNYLQQQNAKLKHELSTCKNKGGAKQALRDQVTKNHETIKKLSDANKELKRKLKQQIFEADSKAKQGRRQNKQLVQQIKDQENKNQAAVSTMNELSRKVEFLSSELGQTKQELQKEQKDNLNHEITIDQLRNTQEGGKILSQYEMEGLKQQLSETEALLRQQETSIVKLEAQNRYLSDEGTLKTEAIDNLEKIVDELMKRRNSPDSDDQKPIVDVSNYQLLQAELAELKSILSLAKSDNRGLQQEIENLQIRNQQKTRQNATLVDELTRLKAKTLQARRKEGVLLSSENQIEQLRANLKKEQLLNNKLQALHQDSDNEKALMKRELREMAEEFEVYEKNAKTQINSLKLQVVELQEQNNLLGIRLKEKDQRVVSYEEKMQEMLKKLNLLRDQVNSLEEEKHNILRQRHRLQKTYEQTLRSLEECKGKDLQALAISENQISWHKKQIMKLSERLEVEFRAAQEFKAICDSMQAEKQVLMSDKAELLRQNQALNDECRDLETRLLGHTVI